MFPQRQGAAWSTRGGGRDKPKAQPERPGTFLQKVARRDKRFSTLRGEHCMRLLRRPKLLLGVFVLLALGQVRAEPQSVALFYNRALAQAQTPSAAQPQADLSQLQAQLQQAQDKLKDWPNLGRYHDANSQVPPPALEEDRVVFMGDSITDGWGRPYGKFFPGKPYVNRGISGQTTPQMLIRFRPDVIALRPKAVVILAGTNDIAGNTGPATLEAIEDNLASMSELARVSGMRVVLASL